MFSLLKQRSIRQIFHDKCEEWVDTMLWEHVSLALMNSPMLSKATNEVTLFQKGAAFFRTQPPNERPPPGFRTKHWAK